MRIRSQNMLASAEEAGRISAILKEDISQMGAKGWGVSSASGQTFEIADQVYIDASSDLSSFTLDKTGNFDKLTFKKVHYDANGICGAVMTIEWSVANDILTRKCTSVKPSKCTGAFAAATDCPPNIEMARNVSEFRLMPSKPGTEGSSPTSTDEILFPTGSNLFALVLSNAASSSQALEVRLGSFTKNSSASANATDYYFATANSGTSCQSFNFKVDEEYVIEFELPNSIDSNGPCVSGEESSATCDRYNKMAMFQPGRDHLSVGLRSTNKGPPISSKIPDFLFYPPQHDNATNIKRNFTFSIPPNAEGVANKTLSACIGITAAFYSEAAGGHLDFKNFKVYRKIDDVYYFDQSVPDYNPTASSTPNKASVKAFRLTLKIDKKGEAKLDTIVIPVPNNGVGGA
jgi:hypothetical protein